MTAKKLASPDLSRRERQVLDALYRAGQATCAEVQKTMTDPPSHSAVRTFLRILEDKELVRHEQDGARYVYIPTVEREGQSIGSAPCSEHIFCRFSDASDRRAT
jgi:predicted transcriptional regulator